MYPAEKEGSPLIILNDFAGDGSGVVKAMEDIGCGDCTLLDIGGLDWDHDMSPWHCPPLSRGGTPCTGGADEYLGILTGTILPEALARIPGAPAFIGIAGYSLAGLFALYSMYHTDCFSRIASMSGSLWFPGFAEYAGSHGAVRRPDRIYLSLGDRESRTRNAALKSVQKNTEFLAELYRGQSIQVEYELNPGNHFADAAKRSAKGIAALLDRQKKQAS